jgi:hypothetical protein
MAFLAAMIPGSDPDRIRSMVDAIPDPGGLFYRYSLPASILNQKRRSVRK